jgi:transcriptional regulator with XRE-family HTH domain
MAVVDRPRHVIVWYRGAPYELDLVKCRRALVMRQVEGELDNMNSLARAVGVSRSTASRFFSGRSTSLAVTLRILQVLRLTFEEVAKPASDEIDDESGRASSGDPSSRNDLS